MLSEAEMAALTPPEGTRLITQGRVRTTDWVWNTLEARWVHPGPNDYAILGSDVPCYHAVARRVQDIHDEGPSIEEVLALDGQIHAMLSDEQRRVLDYYVKRGRKFGIRISLCKRLAQADLDAMDSVEKMEARLARANSRIEVERIRVSG